MIYRLPGTKTYLGKSEVNFHCGSDDAETLLWPNHSHDITRDNKQQNVLCGLIKGFSPFWSVDVKRTGDKKGLKQAWNTMTGLLLTNVCMAFLAFIFQRLSWNVFKYIGKIYIKANVPVSSTELRDWAPGPLSTSFQEGGAAMLPTDPSHGPASNVFGSQ